MNNDFTVIESRIEKNGSARHVVQAPRGSVVVGRTMLEILRDEFVQVMLRQKTETTRSIALLKRYANSVTLYAFPHARTARLFCDCAGSRLVSLEK
jgi:hypothetical protein